MQIEPSASCTVIFSQMWLIVTSFWTVHCLAKRCALWLFVVLFGRLVTSFHRCAMWCFLHYFLLIDAVTPINILVNIRAYFRLGGAYFSAGWSISGFRLSYMLFLSPQSLGGICSVYLILSFLHNCISKNSFTHYMLAMQNFIKMGWEAPQCLTLFRHIARHSIAQCRKYAMFVVSRVGSVTDRASCDRHKSSWYCCIFDVLAEKSLATQFCSFPQQSFLYPGRYKKFRQRYETYRLSSRHCFSEIPSFRVRWIFTVMQLCIDDAAFTHRIGDRLTEGLPGDERMLFD